MNLSQAAILAPVPRVGRYLFFTVSSAHAYVQRGSLARLAELADVKRTAQEYFLSRAGL